MVTRAGQFGQEQSDVVSNLDACQLNDAGGRCDLIE
jgi:hypothetical protein